MENNETRKESPHTPGPWNYTEDHNNTWWSIFADTPFTIAVIENKWRKAEINEANAKLIAASPDLLTALQNITAISEAIIEDHASYISNDGNDRREMEQRERFFKFELSKHLDKLQLAFEESIEVLIKATE